MSIRGPLLLIVLLAAVTDRACAQQVPDGIVVETLAPGLSAPVGFDFLPDGRVLYVEQIAARLRLFREGAGVQATPVLSVTGVATGGERGLLGVAVDPRYPTSPYVYLHYDVAGTSTIRISRYTLAGDLNGTGGDLTADPATRFDVVTGIPDVATNHNGGTLRFGLDGLLYSSLGDDASSCSAQTPGLRGSILRLETRSLAPGPGRAFFAQLVPPDNPFHASSDSAAELVAAYGLRNPFRLQIDPETGDLAIGDVGLNTREELDLLSPPGPVALAGRQAAALGAPLGTNFGWPYFEGTLANSNPNVCGPQPPGLVGPVFDYDRTQQTDAAIIAAGFYRSRNGQPRTLPADHVGDLFANDYYSGALYRLKLGGGAWSVAPPIPGQPSPAHWGEGFSQISDWRVGPDGAFWFCRQGVNFAANTGSIGRVWGAGTLPVPPPHPGATYALRLRVSPAVGSAELLIATPVAARLRIADAQGRLVRRLPQGSGLVLPGPERTLVWDGRDENGRAVPPGIYVAFLDAVPRRLTQRIALVR